MRIVVLLLFFSCLAFNGYSQQEVRSKVSITLKYKDAKGKKQIEKKELTGADAENFDVEAYEKELANRDIEILNLDINQSSTKTSGANEESLHLKHDDGIKKSIIIKKVRTIGEDGDVQETIEQIEEGDTETFEIEERDGKYYVNGKAVDGKQKQVRIMRSSDEEKEIKVEVKDGQVFINSEEVEEGNVTEKNIWISDDGATHEMKTGDHNMIFFSDDSQKPRMGAMIEDGQEVNGAAIVEIVPDSPAAKAGLRAGDVVTGINDTKVYGASSMLDALSDFNAGDEVLILYSRNGKALTTKLQLEKMHGGMSKSIQKKIIIKTEEDKQ